MGSTGTGTGTGTGGNTTMGLSSLMATLTESVGQASAPGTQSNCGSVSFSAGGGVTAGVTVGVAVGVAVGVEV